MRQTLHRWLVGNLSALYEKPCMNRTAKPRAVCQRCRNSTRSVTPLRRVFCCLLLACSSIAGEVVDWPDHKPEKWNAVSVSKLPAGVNPHDPEDPQRSLSTVQVRKVDVDGDGVADLIVSTGRGGTGGSYVYVYRREGKGYREVLAEQGGIVVRPKVNGVARIECWSRVGGGEYRRTVYRFNGKRFVEEFTDGLRHREDDRFDLIERKKAASP